MYDLVILGIFAVFLTWFLYRGRKNLTRDGILLLYRTPWGVKLIERIGNKYKKTLDFLGYISVGLGYLLMVGVLWLTYSILKIYIFRPDVVSAIKVPPIMPLIPYIDKVVPFLPPFYFTYWIVILAIVAIFHEFAHGIYMARHGIKIKSTGFGFFPFFLPIFPAAFVEQDEKSMMKAKNYPQRAVLSAGTFANTLTAIFFFVVLWGFFSLAFTPAGVMFDDYSYNVVNTSAITMINGVAVVNPSMDKIAELSENASFNNITADGEDYVGIKGFGGDGLIALYDNSPAINAQLSGPITKIDDYSIKNLDELSSALLNYSPGDVVTVTTIVDGKEQNYEITLGQHPEENKAWLGVVFIEDSGGSSLMRKIFSVLSSFRGSNVYYESKIGDIGLFIYNLLWWLIIICISVALVNMLPVGIFDGGKFFFLTLVSLGMKEESAFKVFRYVTRFFLILLLGIMVFWAIALIF